jgi:DNA-binding transcriptional MerR regulator
LTFTDGGRSLNVVVITPKGDPLSTAAEEGFRGPQVCKIVGITYRQLDYWARTGLATPSVKEAEGSGSQRLYSFEDLVELKVIKNLLDAGVSLQQVRQAVSYLHELGHDVAGITLASDGTSIFACKSPDEFVDLLRRGQGVFGIAIDPVKAELRGSVAELRPAGATGEETESPEEPAARSRVVIKAQGES